MKFFVYLKGRAAASHVFDTLSAAKHHMETNMLTGIVVIPNLNNPEILWYNAGRRK